MFTGGYVSTRYYGNAWGISITSNHSSICGSELRNRVDYGRHFNPADAHVNSAVFCVTLNFLSRWVMESVDYMTSDCATVLLLCYWLCYYFDVDGIYLFHWILFYCSLLVITRLDFNSFYIFWWNFPFTWFLLGTFQCFGDLNSLEFSPLFPNLVCVSHAASSWGMVSHFW